MRSKIPDLIENKLSNNIDLLEKQINFLKEECHNKTLIINILLEQIFQTCVSKSRNTGNPDKFSKTVANDCSAYPKIQLQHLLEGPTQVFNCNYQSFFCIIT